MATLQELRLRQKSIKSTRKITLAMKMIATAKLKKAQDKVAHFKPYALAIGRLTHNILNNATSFDTLPEIMTGRKEVKVGLIILITSDRGLCGGFNTIVVRHARQLVQTLQAAAIQPKFIFVGRQGYEALQRDFDAHVLARFSTPDMPPYALAQEVSESLLKAFEAHTIDQCHVVYNRYVTPLTQEVMDHPLIPFETSFGSSIDGNVDPSVASSLSGDSSGMESMSGNLETGTQPALTPYVYEPTVSKVLSTLLKKNITVQIFKALIDSAAGEKGARMMAMDGATRNADEMIRDLSLLYNRTRQAKITSELIEIIAGAESLEG